MVQITFIVGRLAKKCIFSVCTRQMAETTNTSIYTTILHALLNFFSNYWLKVIHKIYQIGSSVFHPSWHIHDSCFFKPSKVLPTISIAVKKNVENLFKHKHKPGKILQHEHTPRLLDDCMKT